jgi:hypothetical protein
MPSAGLELAIATFQRLQTYALDLTATGIGILRPLHFLINDL